MTGVTAAGDGLTFAAYADRIGKSRPYVSKLKAQGVLHGPAFTADGRILPDVADAQIAASADPARAPRGVASPGGSEATYARERARKTAAEAERAEIELRARKGELVPRTLLAATWAPHIRQLRDELLAAPRDTVLDPVQAADCEARIAATLEAFSARLAQTATETTDGGASAAG